jgi:hypothetical protein
MMRVSEIAERNHVSKRAASKKVKALVYKRTPQGERSKLRLEEEMGNLIPRQDVATAVARDRALRRLG